MRVQTRRVQALEEVLANVDDLTEDLHDCLPAELKKDLLRAVWLFAKDADIAPGDLDFPLDRLPDTKAARDCLAQYEAAVLAWSERASAREKFQYHQKFAEAVRRWLSDNPHAERILHLYRREYKRLNRLDQTAHDQPAKIVDSQERIQSVKNALLSLDPNNDEHWTRKGLPQTSVVAYISRVLNLTRDELIEIAPGYDREAARMTANERF